MRSTATASLLVVALAAIGARASLSASFLKYVTDTFSKAAADNLQRTDIGPWIGSYGGGKNGNVKHKPVIVVHGITNTAGTFFDIRKYFLDHGYADNELYSTTYGDGGKTNMLFVTMECHYVKTIRMLILSVAQYTSSKVNIIAISMGSPIARKAVMGGRCVDTGEDIGPPLTQFVDTFVGVAGANHGSVLCVFPFGSCNLSNGMSCLSSYIKDINAKSRYEGSKIFSIYSNADDRVGYYACGTKASSIPGENRAIEKQGLSHDDVIHKTVDIQFNLVTHGHP